MSDIWTVRKATAWTTDYLQQKGVDSPRTDADLLLADALGVDRVRLIIDSDKPLTKEELAAYRRRIERRAAGEPLAYILGRREFYGRDFRVDERVLIPRPETEGLVDLLLQALPDGASRVLDLCAGSGCVGITLALERPGLSVDLVEIDSGAAAVARSNVEKHGVGDRVRVLVGDLFAPVRGEPPYDGIVGNPPYVPAGEIPGLSREVRREPRLALDGGPDGLDLVRRIAREAGEHLVPGGPLALELAIEQPRAAARLFREAGFAEAHVEQDFSHRDRYVVATR